MVYETEPPHSDGLELYQMVDKFVDYYNNDRLHQSLDYVTPAEYYNYAA